MFTFVCCLFLVTFAFPSACHKDCWFTKKTSGSVKDCYGKVLPLTVNLARDLGVEQGEAFACLKHRRGLAKEDDRCSSTLLKTHSKKLLAIPQKLYQFLDDRGRMVNNYLAQPSGTIMASKRVGNGSHVAHLHNDDCRPKPPQKILYIPSLPKTYFLVCLLSS